MEQRILTFTDVWEAIQLLDKLLENRITKESYLHIIDQELDLRIRSWGHKFWKTIINVIGEEYIKDLETIEIEVRKTRKMENITLSHKQTLVEMIKKHEILWLANIHAL